jgi:transposase
VLLDNPRLQTELFPKYAPELNPVEQVWHDFKSHTANSMPQDTAVQDNRGVVSCLAFRG